MHLKLNFSLGPEAICGQADNLPPSQDPLLAKTHANTD